MNGIASEEHQVFLISHVGQVSYLPEFSFPVNLGKEKTCPHINLDFYRSRLR